MHPKIVEMLFHFGRQSTVDQTDEMSLGWSQTQDAVVPCSTP